MICKLSDVCEFRKDKIKVELLSLDTYISTENMLQNKCGVTSATTLPNCTSVNQFFEGDILLSNIRPYLKKIWYADYAGGCSNDVLVVKNKSNILKDYLYYILSTNSFFDYATMTAKGTKMPRGDKTAIMNYEFDLPELSEQEEIIKILNTIDKKIENNKKIIANYNKLIEANFHEMFIQKMNLGTPLEGWKVLKFSDFITETKEKCGERKIPVYSVTNDGLALREERFKKVLSANTEKNKVIYKGDLVFGLNTDILNWDVMEDEIGIISPAYMSYKVHNKVNPTYLKYYIKLQINKFKDLIKLSTRIGQGLDKGALMNKELYIPPKDELEKFISLSNALKLMISNKNLENKNLSELRDTLLDNFSKNGLRK